MPDDPTQDAIPPQRAAVYIDGFNLYYAVVEMEEPHLKWCNLWHLSEIICADQKLALQKVVFCTAMTDHKPASLARHQTFNAVQLAKGVEIIKGHYIFNEELGRYNEKQSDINVALSLIMDGVDDLYDWAYLVSADSDQAATARVFRERFPEKKLALVAPPNRFTPEKALPYADIQFSITRLQMERAILPQYVPTGQDRMIRRPTDYDPPSGWLHPNDRRKRKR